MKVNSESIGLNSLKLLPENPNSDEMCLYYKFTPSPGVKFISLDCYDISVLGHDPNHQNYITAAELLHKYHGHYDWDLWDTDDNLLGSDIRFQSSNGAISEEQLKWLENELQESDLKEELVIVFGHVGLHPDSSEWNTIMWNYEEVIACFNRHPSVVAYLSGHAHNHGYASANGVHYVVFQAIIETSPQYESFATISLFDDRMEIEGHGVEQSRVLYLQNRTYASDHEVLDIVDDVSHEEIATNPTVEVEV
jgi:manganese-dependent ADP-ribose/CDP-alcohol diphosphatase